MSTTPDEWERRANVALEKVWGAIIESVERMREEPVARSIVLRFFFLYQSLSEFPKNS